MEAITYKQHDDGLYHFYLYGRLTTGFKPAATEEEAKRRKAQSDEDSRAADEADAIYSRMYCY